MNLFTDLAYDWMMNVAEVGNTVEDWQNTKMKQMQEWLLEIVFLLVLFYWFWFPFGA